jgi:Flp pilus assembly protein TadG
MQRLTLRRRQGRGRRLRDERGAAAVLFALVLVPMLGFTAIAVDIGSIYAERSRLQTAADAAALAVAQDCARGNCGDMQATANAMVAANDPNVATAPPVLSSSPLSVTVSGNKPTRHWFAPVLGIDSTQVRASATVAWGEPGAGTAVLPLTFSWCEFSAQTGGGLPSGTTVRTIYFTKTSGTGCTGPSGNAVPGGFAYIDTTGGKCQAASSRGGLSSSSTGNSAPSSCQPTDFSAWVGRTVLLPLYDQAGSTGTNAWYHVYAYAGFELTGYFLGGQYKTSPAPCSGNARCIAGYFTRFVDLSDRFTYTNDGPDTGASILRLIK